jgi:Fuc2NAc and GlcNAc transferase
VILLAVAGAAVLSWLLTAAVRRYALTRLLDVPNRRSAHKVPTARGGGLAIALVVLGGVAAAHAAGAVPFRTAAALVGGGVMIAGVGWVDDHGGLPARLRALVHFAAAAWALFWLGGMPRLELGVGAAHLGPAGAVLAALGIVWVTNLYNFMDGIDGIAGGQAVVVGVAGGALLWAAGAPALALAALLVAGASAGFLLWNWQPARIFMGDVGSGAIGYAFGVLALASENAGAVPALVWLLLLGVFVVDATVTLLRRMARREPFLHAHRSHAYQRAVQGGSTHARVASAVLLIDLVLALLAAAAVLRPAWTGAAWAVGAALLLLVYLRVERLVPMRPPRPAPAADHP